MNGYEKNLQALREHHPEVAELLECPIETDHIQVIHAKSGAARLLVRTESGATLAVHNEDDPIKVARRTAAKIRHLEGVLVVLGMGLGYLAKYLAEDLENGAALIVYEADPGIFKTALKEVDLSALFSSPQVKVVVGPDANISQWAYYYLLKTGGTVQVARFEPAFRLNPELYQKKLGPELLQTTKSALTNLATAKSFGPIFTKNIIESIPHIVSTQGVNALHNQFQGETAIIVAAGPSLGKNVQVLKRAKNHAVIICADTVLGYLLARRITPDFVVSVDPQVETYYKFKEIDIPRDVSLVFHPSCHEQIVKHFPGPKFVTESGMLAYQWLKAYWPAKGAIDRDVQCQVHLGFNLAEWIGCQNIILIGQDLCYTDDRMHVRGGSYLSEKDERQYVNTGAKVENIFGEHVGTYPVYLSYRSLWEKKVKEFRGIVLNATEGGLNISGARNCLLTDALLECCSDATFSVIQKILPLSENVDVPNLMPLTNEIRDRLRDFHRLQRVSRRLMRMLTDMKVRRKNTKQVDEELARMSHRCERLTSLIPRYANTLGLLQMIDFKLELYMVQDRTNAIDEIENELERFDKQIERGLRFYGDIQNAVPFMRNCLTPLHGRLERLQDLFEKIYQGKAPGPLGQDLALVEECNLLELFDKAEDIISRHLGDKLSADGESEKFAILRMRNALELHQIHKAVQAGSDADRLFPQNPEVRSLRAQVAEQWDHWQSKVQSVGKACEIVDRPVLADGDFYFQLGQYECAADHYQRIAEHARQNNQVRGEAWYRVAQSHQQAQQTESAVWALEQALLIDPANSRVYFDLGVQSLANGVLESAERFFEKGAEIALDDPEYCEAVGAVLSAAGAHSEAILFYERGLVRNPADGDLLEKINNAYQSVFEVTHSV